MIRLTLTPLFVAISFMFAGATAAMDKENTLYIDLKDGRVVIEMRPDLAPTHVAQIKKLAREGKYDGVVFHRVIEGFMAQTGDPKGNGTGGSGRKIKAEFTPTPAVSWAILDHNQPAQALQSLPQMAPAPQSVTLAQALQRSEQVSPNVVQSQNTLTLPDGVNVA